MSQWKAFVQDLRYEDRLRLHIMRKPDHPGTEGRDIAQPMILKSFAPHMAVPEQECFLQDSYMDSDDVKGFIRAIMTAGWELGIRPDGFENHTNELRAVREHLADMRKLAKVPGA